MRELLYIMESKISLYYCNNCEQFKELMDMHTWDNGKCKICWSKEENMRNSTRGGNRKGYKNGKR